MKLPHLHVLQRQARAQRHAGAITGAHVGIRRAGVNASRTPCGEHRRLRVDEDDFTTFQFDCDDSDHRSILIGDQINGEPFIEERGIRADVGLVERVQ